MSHNTFEPLAQRMRPRSLESYYGQEHLVGYDAAGTPQVLRKLIEDDNVSSMIFWGPPGSGKTTLAKIIAEVTAAHFIELSAVGAGVKEVRAAIVEAESLARLGTKTILFIDEVHRFNKSQQDAFLPYVEKGVVTFIGATTENPSFEINNALLSRSRVFVLEALSVNSLVQLLREALSDHERGVHEEVEVAEEDLLFLAQMVHGDARQALNTLEMAVSLMDVHTSKRIVRAQIEAALQKSSLHYDKNGEEHYNIISAFHKSMRGNDPDAALYWLTRMLEGGEDPLYIARRIVRVASEDIGLANSLALPQATAAYDACRFIGMPECGVNLAQAAVYMAKSKKSVMLYKGYKQALADVKEYGHLPVPLHLRNAPTKLMKEVGYGDGYVYTPEASAEKNQQQRFLPEELENKTYL